MPDFPNISTLNRVQPTGDEEIQISATQKARLKDIAALVSTVLTGDIAYSFVELDGIGRVDKVGIIGYVQADDKYNVIAFRVSKSGAELEKGFRSLSSISVPESNPAEYLVGLINTWSPLNSPDILVISSGEEITINPGYQIYFSGEAINDILFPKSSWDYDVNRNKFGEVYQASILSFGVNITKSMFGQSGDYSDTSLNFIFSENFDDNPGTDYQLVAIQAYKVSSNQMVLVVNKSGYSS